MQQVSLFAPSSPQNRNLTAAEAAAVAGSFSRSAPLLQRANCSTEGDRDLTNTLVCCQYSCSRSFWQPLWCLLCFEGGPLAPLKLDWKESVVFSPSSLYRNRSLLYFGWV